MLLTSFGFDYATGDFAARLAAEQLPSRSTRSSSPTGAKRGRTSPGHAGRSGASWAAAGRVEGRLVASRFGKTTRRLRFPTASEAWSSVRARASDRSAAHATSPRALVLRAPAARASRASYAARRPFVTRGPGRRSPVRRARDGNAGRSSRRRARVERGARDPQRADVYGLRDARRPARRGASRRRGARAPARSHRRGLRRARVPPRLAPLLEIAAVETTLTSDRALASGHATPQAADGGRVLCPLLRRKRWRRRPGRAPRAAAPATRRRVRRRAARRFEDRLDGRGRPSRSRLAAFGAWTTSAPRAVWHLRQRRHAVIACLDDLAELAALGRS